MPISLIEKNNIRKSTMRPLEEDATQSNGEKPEKGQRKARDRTEIEQESRESRKGTMEGYDILTGVDGVE